MPSGRAMHTDHPCGPTGVGGGGWARRRASARPGEIGCCWKDGVGDERPRTVVGRGVGHLTGLAMAAIEGVSDRRTTTTTKTKGWQQRLGDATDSSEILPLQQREEERISGAIETSACSTHPTDHAAIMSAGAGEGAYRCVLGRRWRWLCSGRLDKEDKI